MTYTATVKPKGRKFFHELVKPNGETVTRTSAKQYGFAIIATVGAGYEPFVAGWASKPRAAGSKMEKYWTVVESVPVEPVS